MHSVKLFRWLAFWVTVHSWLPNFTQKQRLGICMPFPFRILNKIGYGYLIIINKNWSMNPINRQVHIFTCIPLGLFYITLLSILDGRWCFCKLSRTWIVAAETIQGRKLFVEIWNISKFNLTFFSILAQPFDNHQTWKREHQFPFHQSKHFSNLFL